MQNTPLVTSCALFPVFLHSFINTESPEYRQARIKTLDKTSGCIKLYKYSCYFCQNNCFKKTRWQVENGLQITSL